MNPKRPAHILSIITAATLLTSLPSFAASRYYVGPDGGNWSDTANWSATSGGPGGASVPTTNDSVSITTNAQVLQNFNYTPATTLISILIAGSALNAPSVIQNGNALDVQTLTIGPGAFILNAGTLTANSETIGGNGTATFTQNGGANTASLLSINSPSTYHLSAGTLTVNRDLYLNGTLDFGGGNATLAAGPNSIIDLTRGTFLGSAQTTFSIDPHSIIMVPQNFDPQSQLKSVTGGGLLHIAGTPLNIPAGASLSYSGQINDQVVATGNISSGSPLILNNGAIVSGGTISAVPQSVLYVNDLTSGISSGSLLVEFQIVGGNGTAKFTQTGGLNAADNFSSFFPDPISLTLGSNTNANGTYELDGGTLSAQMTIGLSGSGTFIQNGGTLTTEGSDIDFPSYFAENPGSTATIQLNNGNMSQLGEYIGYSGNATFTQNGGNHTLISDITAGALYLGHNAGSLSTYTLNNGNLTAPYEYIGSTGTGIFLQAGGSNTVTTLTIASTSLYTLTAGTLTATTVYNNGNFAISGGTASLNILINNANFTASGGNITMLELVNTASTTIAAGASIHLSAYADLSSAHTFIGISSPTSFGQIIITGSSPSSTLTNLQFSFSNGYVPALGDSFKFLTATPSRSARFATISAASPLPAGLGIAVTYTTTSATATIARLGDANLDGTIDINDLNTLAANWQKNLSNWALGDFNGDGIINIADLNALAANWQTTSGSSTEPFTPAFPTPEPASLCILSLASIALFHRRRSSKQRA